MKKINRSQLNQAGFAGQTGYDRLEPSGGFRREPVTSLLNPLCEAVDVDAAVWKNYHFVLAQLQGDK